MKKLFILVALTTLFAFETQAQVSYEKELDCISKNESRVRVVSSLPMDTHSVNVKSKSGETLLDLGIQIYSANVFNNDDGDKIELFDQGRAVVFEISQIVKLSRESYTQTTTPQFVAVTEFKFKGHMAAEGLAGQEVECSYRETVTELNTGF